MKAFLAILAAVALITLLGCQESKTPEKPLVTKAPDNAQEKTPDNKGQEQQKETKTGTKEQEQSQPAETPTDKIKKEPVPADDEEVGIMETNYGTIVIRFYPDLAPKTVARIKDLIRQGFYDGLIFHRIVPDFCIQGGDPSGTGRGGTGETLPPEFTKTPFEDGSIGMARSDSPNSGDCQFFITLSRKPFLDNNYTLFGKVIEGLDVAHKIEKVELDDSRPKKKVSIIKFSLKKMSER